MTHEQAFLDAIIADPANDSHRLIYADWLEERNGPGDSERTEFIRVQCELVRGYDTPPDCELLPANTCSGRNGAREAIGLGFAIWCSRCYPIVALRHRERELLEKHLGWFDRKLIPWFNPDGRISTGRGELGREGEGPSIYYNFRRGFVAEVRCRLEDWCGRECERCEGLGECSTEDFDGRTYHRGDCYKCHGTGRIDVHGPEIVRRHPVERVVLTDKRPLKWSPDSGSSSFDYDPQWSWLNPTVPSASSGSVIPLPIYDLIESVRVVRHAKRFDSEQAALSALSDACIAWAKAEKG